MYNKIGDIMFTLKVGWKKRLIIGLVSIIPMIVLVTWFLIICIQKKVFDGIAVSFVFRRTGE